MKILLLTQWFEPEPTFKGLLFAQALREQGHEVEVLTGFPNYPGGKVYDGYKISFYQKEIMDGIVVHRVPLYPSHDSSSFKRILNYISFAVSSSVFGLVKTRMIDVIYSYHPPLTTSLSALFISFFKRVPFVVDIQDLWPDTLTATGMVKNTKVLNVVNMACHLVYRQASKIVVLSPGFKKRLIDRGVSESKIEVIYNWCNESALENHEECSVKLPSNGKLNLVFAGNLGFAQGLPAIIDAAEILKEGKVDVNIVFVGDGVAKADAINISQVKTLDNVYFLPRVPMTQIGSILLEADMLLVHLNDDELFRITIPSRTQANLATGKPIVMGVKGDAADLIDMAGAGLICEPNNPVLLADAIKKLVEKTPQEREMMGHNAKHFYNENLSLRKGVSRFISIFEDIQ
ncbi:glycosyltransferase family 4 protein [Vibrio fluvialis]|uniref:glycosyltransferase family 4 protein n=1 Tax=Vibrio fluvialis TaxID=676 RepID=UPI00155918B5|nr:glycosyltransferase family 4 protein [Vibrio fluvialis]EKO3369873.1 glycosyltransferase family 4 protein [Vibrio fluvialis]EKO3387403.1 glycosyltransferase family 4 protein [Vibrio fluvialis]EKO3492089.1 glycosyltransferase family 4 protein [Vibrio fluvialis]EKO3550828.1 glycosyltransferase family 4 protein [Vibrio fluvialis]EKO3555164.1 glycosyltransferase family 4 protein [Vibrio fluvialis]